MKGSGNGGGGRSELRPHLGPDCGILHGSAHGAASSTAGSQLCRLTPFIEDFQFSVFRFHNLYLLVHLIHPLGWYKATPDWTTAQLPANLAQL